MMHLAFADIAESSENFTLAIAHVDGDKVRIDGLYQHVPPFSRARIIEEFSSVLREQGISTVGRNKFSSEWPRGEFGRHGVICEPCGRDRAALYAVFFAMLDAGEVVLPRHDGLDEQLRRVRRRRWVSGGPDDLVNVIAGVCELAREHLKEKANA